MAIKQIFSIKDEILDDKYEVFGQSGFLHDDDYNIMLIDPWQVAQTIMEDTAEAIDDERYECHTIDIKNRAREIAEYIYHICEYEFTKNTEYIIADEDDTELR